MNADGIHKEENKVMYHFRRLTEDQVLIWNSWQQLKWNWWEVKKKKKNLEKIANTHGQAIRA